MGISDLFFRSFAVTAYSDFSKFGQVGILCITDKQFSQIELFYGKKAQTKKNMAGQQLELF